MPLNFGGARPDGSAALNTVDGSKPFYSSFFGQSSFARTTVVNRSSVVKVSEDTDLQLLAPLGCGFQTGAGAVLRTLDVQANSTVAIFGVGSVGMSAIMAAKIRGAKEIIAVDLQQGRLDLALKVGATQAVRGDDPDLVKKIQQLAPPDGVNYAVDCSGVASVVDKMMDCLGTRGRAASVGAPAVGFHTDEQAPRLMNGLSSRASKQALTFSTTLFPAKHTWGAAKVIRCRVKFVFREASQTRQG